MIIKVCGMTDAENITAVEHLGADMIGMVFYRHSCISPWQYNHVIQRS